MQTPQAVTAMDIELTVNGERVVRRVPVRQNLADFLRDTLGLTGTHVGCEHGVCGACTVRCDGAIVRACLMLAVQADGTYIVTIEGAASAGYNAEVMAELQREFHQRNALQCGFCTPGMVMAATSLLKEIPNPTEEEVRIGLEGNLCRCTGYHNIVKAVLAAAGK